MGVDFYACRVCGSTFPDCSDYCRWCDCGGRFCSSECAKIIEDEDNPNSMTCCLCRKEEATDNDLLVFLLDHFKLTREQVMELYRNGEQGNLPSPS
jgi:hypothetical protein